MASPDTAELNISHPFLFIEAIAYIDKHVDRMLTQMNEFLSYLFIQKIMAIVYFVEVLTFVACLPNVPAAQEL